MTLEEICLDKISIEQEKRRRSHDEPSHKTNAAKKVKDERMQKLRDTFKQKFGEDLGI